MGRKAIQNKQVSDPFKFGIFSFHIITSVSYEIGGTLIAITRWQLSFELKMYPIYKSKIRMKYTWCAA